MDRPGARSITGSVCVLSRETAEVYIGGETDTGFRGVHLNPPGPLPMHLHTVYMEYSECLPTLLTPLAERACFSKVYISAWMLEPMVPTELKVRCPGSNRTACLSKDRNDRSGFLCSPSPPPLRFDWESL
jgi:hypothetical protein